MFFSVKSAMIIGNKVYYPCICYEVSPALEETVFFLKNKGKAEIYPVKVHFQNGKVIENLDNITKRKSNKSSKPKNSGSKGISIPERLDQRLKNFSEAETEAEDEPKSEEDNF